MATISPYTTSAFKAYDIRGRVPDQLNESIARRIGSAFAQVVQPKRVVVGHDIRLSGPAIEAALVEGLTAAGVDVQLLGLCGTEEVYFATAHLQADGGIMITASHNPAEYNGMKMVRRGAVPISGDSGLKEMAALVADEKFTGLVAPTRGGVTPVDCRNDYVQHVLGYVDSDALKSLKVVVNAGNGCAGVVVDALATHLPFSLIRLQHEPDGHFPNGVPNPLLPQNRESTAAAVKQHSADLGVAWDGDFDRCFFFDEQGNFIEGYYIVGLLAEEVLQKHPSTLPSGKIIYDPRLTWNTIELVTAAGGTPVLCKSGHAFIKERMRAEDAIYGGEMSAHHYFRDFSYCDSGMIPWLLVAAAMSQKGRKLSELVGDCMRKFPASGEINRKIADPAGAMQAVWDRYAPQARVTDKTDGISFEFDTWRFNLRMSNTEPYIRLNVESRGDSMLMHQKTDEILAMLAERGAEPAE